MLHQTAELAALVAELAAVPYSHQTMKSTMVETEDQTEDTEKTDQTGADRASRMEVLVKGLPLERSAMQMANSMREAVAAGLDNTASKTATPTNMNLTHIRGKGELAEAVKARMRLEGRALGLNSLYIQLKPERLVMEAEAVADADVVKLAALAAVV